MPDIAGNQLTAVIDKFRFQPRGNSKFETVRVGNDFNSTAGLQCCFCVSFRIDDALKIVIVISGVFAVNEVLNIKMSMVNNSTTDLTNVTFEDVTPVPSPAPTSVASLLIDEVETHEWSYTVTAQNVADKIIRFSARAEGTRSDDSTLEESNQTTEDIEIP